MAMSSEERRRRMHRAVGGAGTEGQARRPRKSYEELMDGIPEEAPVQRSIPEEIAEPLRRKSERDLFGVMDLEDDAFSGQNVFEQESRRRMRRRADMGAEYSDAREDGEYTFRGRGREDDEYADRSRNVGEDAYAGGSQNRYDDEYAGGGRSRGDGESVRRSRRREDGDAVRRTFGSDEEEAGTTGRSRRSGGTDSRRSGEAGSRHSGETDSRRVSETGSRRSGDTGRIRGRSGEPGSERRTGRDDGSGFDPRIIVMAVCLLAAILLLVFGIRALAKRGSVKASQQASESESVSVEESIEASIEESIEAEPETEAADVVLKKAKHMAAQYDYDGAIDLLKNETDYENNEEAQMAVAEYEEIKGTLVRQEVREITHVFFHILMPDPANALDPARWGKQAGGYNSLMTTVTEFEKMLQEFYDKGFVLVRIHDMAHIEKQADGSEKMVEGDIMLPPGKKGMVMSEDDVCYYEYMEGAAFADKMIVGEDGRPTTHIVKTDGTEDVGDYDLVPILDHFIDEHPDFSYKGAKAIIAFTGYNGILGYRTDETYEPGFDKNAVGYGSAMTPNPNIEADRAEAVKVLKALVDDGYELSSHSWGHRDMGAIDLGSFRTDTNRWDKNVNSLIKEATGEPCDILIYPKGADIADWHGYSHSNERYNYLYDKGFRYFCNVDSAQHWVQVGEDYLRQGRRALDGLNMWIDIHDGKNRLSDLFDNVSDIFDPARPTPVDGYY